jgi:hypothetical protein
MTEENAVVEVMHDALIVETMLPPQRPLVPMHTFNTFEKRGNNTLTLRYLRRFF